MQRSIALYIAALLMLCFTKANAATADRSFQYNDTVRTYTPVSYTHLTLPTIGG